MKAGKITAKLRDAVPVCLMVNGTEVGRHKNIELPDEIKALPIMDFGFITSLTGKFDFNLYFDEGVLPEVLPSVKAKITRAEKRAMKAAMAINNEMLAAQGTVEEASNTEPPATPVTLVMDMADEALPEAPTDEPQAMDEVTAATKMVETVTAMPKKQRGRPKASNTLGEQHSA